MFTGIVEGIGRLADVAATAGGRRVRIATTLASGMTDGDSLAVSGVCLTALDVTGDEVSADIGPETARITTLGELARGQGVNLERPVRVDGRLGGHVVLGHVDGVGTVAATRHDGHSMWLTIDYPSDLARLFIRKGSVAVDGVSLTVAALGERSIDIQVIPYTLEHTTLGDLRPGHRVNLECDVLGKYVLRAAEVEGLAASQRH